jgi:uncharacterized protein
MNRNEYVLLSLAVNDGRQLTPLQVQKQLFLSEKLIGAELSYTPRFDFQPYHYGPFDKAVYDALDSLSNVGHVEILNAGQKHRRYALTEAGLHAAGLATANVDPAILKKLAKIAKFVTSLSFRDLVSVIYREYPEMRVNSVFEKEPA